MQRSIGVGLLALTAACFDPHFDHLMCGADGACPDGQSCGADNICSGGAGIGIGGSGPGSGMSNPAGGAGCFGTLVRVCFTATPITQLSISSDVTINTDTDSLCDQHNDQMTKYCVVVATVFNVPTGINIKALGSKPLVLLATSTTESQRFILSGNIDVGSHRAAPEVRGGGNASGATCPVNAAASGTSGGFGGSFGGKGGDGADGNPDNGANGQAAAPLAAFPPTLRGGCPGGNGGNGTAAAGGAGGSGGGAVALVADFLTVDGHINASGEAGQGGFIGDEDGGGGGGAGGMIILDSPNIFSSSGALLWANGGGGGQGGEQNSAGSDGGESAQPTLPAVGGINALTKGGLGGEGFPANASQMTPANSNVVGGGGGGGGGSAGFIYAPGITGNQISPPSSPAPKD